MIRRAVWLLALGLGVLAVSLSSAAPVAARGPREVAPTPPPAPSTLRCAAGTHVCSGACVPSASPASCGSSCAACPAAANGTATCDGTTCGLTCNAGFHDCGGACVSNAVACVKP